jgi:DNA recombination protein RmuC
MFVPIEPAFSLIIQFGDDLNVQAWDKNIMIVSPMNLFVALRTIAYIWRQENQNKNALEIARQSGDMLDKFTAFVEDLISVGKGLVTAKDNYDKAMNKLVDGRGNLVDRAEKIKKLGAKASKSLPPAILNRSIEDSEE